MSIFIVLDNEVKENNMGLSASQARFLQLTARRSNVEYQAQQINFQRLQWSDKLAAASSEYQDKTSNRKMVYNFNNGDGITQVDVTYQNYKNYMNQQMEGLTTAQDKFFLVSSTGNKIIVGSEEERDAMIERYTTYTPYNASTVNEDENPEVIVQTDEEGNNQQMLVHREFIASDFMIVDDLDDVDNFQTAIQNGIYYFAKRELNTETNMFEFKTESGKNTHISVVKALIPLCGGFLVGAEGIGVFHIKLSCAHYAKARADLVAELRTELIKAQRQLLIGIYVFHHQIGHYFFSGRGQAETGAFAVLKAEQFFAVIGPAG